MIPRSLVKITPTGRRASINSLIAFEEASREPASRESSLTMSRRPSLDNDPVNHTLVRQPSIRRSSIGQPLSLLDEPRARRRASMSQRPVLASQSPGRVFQAPEP
jgi:hypothetical protein